MPSGHSKTKTEKSEDNSAYKIVFAGQLANSHIAEGEARVAKEKADLNLADEGSPQLILHNEGKRKKGADRL